MSFIKLFTERTQCYECGLSVDVLIQVNSDLNYEDDGILLCKDCVEKTLALMVPNTTL